MLFLVWNFRLSVHDGTMKGQRDNNIACCIYNGGLRVLQVLDYSQILAFLPYL